LHGEEPTVLNVNAALLARLSLHIERVLVVDPFPGSARLICDMMRGMGAWGIDHAETTQRAFELAESAHPQLIITELTGPDTDGLPFIQKVRKSALPAARPRSSWSRPRRRSRPSRARATPAPTSS
jgi:CheY-like chemotaxis protein